MFVELNKRIKTRLINIIGFINLFAVPKSTGKDKTIVSSKCTSCGHLAVQASFSPWYGDQRTTIQLEEKNESARH